MRRLNRRRLSVARRVLIVAAALPLCQFSACQTIIGTTAATVANQLPQIVFNGIFQAWFQTLLGALGGSTSGLDDGSGFGGGIGGSGGGGI